MGSQFTDYSCVLPKIAHSVPVYGLKNHQDQDNKAQNGKTIL
jgi:hypothetical protein